MNKIIEIVTLIPFKEISLALLGCFSSYQIWKIQQQKEKIKTIENQLSERKYKIYLELVHIIFDVMSGAKIGNNVSNKELLTRVFEIKKNMFLYASDEMFQAFTEWVLENNKSNNNGVDHFKKYYALLKLVRKDMGQKDTKLTLDDFMIFLIQDKDEYEKFKKQYGW